MACSQGGTERGADGGTERETEGVANGGTVEAVTPLASGSSAMTETVGKAMGVFCAPADPARPRHTAPQQQCPVYFFKPMTLARLWLRGVMRLVVIF